MIYGVTMVFLLLCGFMESQPKFYFLIIILENLIRSLNNMELKKNLQKRYS